MSAIEYEHLRCGVSHCVQTVMVRADHIGPVLCSGHRVRIPMRTDHEDASMRAMLELCRADLRREAARVDRLTAVVHMVASWAAVHDRTGQVMRLLGAAMDEPATTPGYDAGGK